MSGTEIGYAQACAQHRRTHSSRARYLYRQVNSAICYARPMRCPVLTARMVLPGEPLGGKFFPLLRAVP
eukprot:2694309-Rhodomonas_salina.7